MKLQIGMKMKLKTRKNRQYGRGLCSSRQVTPVTPQNPVEKEKLSSELYEKMLDLIGVANRILTELENPQKRMSQQIYNSKIKQIKIVNSTLLKLRRIDVIHNDKDKLRIILVQIMSIKNRLDLIEAKNLETAV